MYTITTFSDTHKIYTKVEHCLTALSVHVAQWCGTTQRMFTLKNQNYRVCAAACEITIDNVISTKTGHTENC